MPPGNFRNRARRQSTVFEKKSLGEMMDDGMLSENRMVMSTLKVSHTHSTNATGLRGFWQRNALRPTAHVPGTKTFNLIHPRSRIYLFWQLVMSCLLLYVAILVPYRLAFDSSDDCTQTLLAGALDFIVDTLFVFDLILNFFVCRVVHGVLVDDRIEVRRDLFRGGFFVMESIKSIPVSWAQFPMLLSGSCSSSLYVLQLLKVLRILRIVRLAKLLDLTKVLQSIGADSSLFRNPNVANLVKMMFFMLFCVHCVACLFWSVKRMDPSLDTWELEQNINGEDSARYLACAYFALATLVTVGYGDVHATNSNERVVACVCMFLGGMVFAAIISNVSSLSMSLVANSNAHEQKLEEVTRFMKARKIPDELQKRVLRFFERFNSDTTSIQGTEVLEELPASIKYDLLRSMSTDTLTKVHIFRNLAVEVIMAIYVRLQPIRVTPGEILIREGEENDSVYFIMQGGLATVENSVITDHLEEGDAYGALDVFSETQADRDFVVRRPTVIATDFTELYFLDRITMHQVLANFPGYLATLRRRALMLHRFRARLAAVARHQNGKAPKMVRIVRRVIENLRAMRSKTGIGGIGSPRGSFANFTPFSSNRVFPTTPNSAIMDVEKVKELLESMKQSSFQSGKIVMPSLMPSPTAGAAAVGNRSQKGSTIAVVVPNDPGERIKTPKQQTHHELHVSGSGVAKYIPGMATDHSWEEDIGDIEMAPVGLSAATTRLESEPPSVVVPSSAPEFPTSMDLPGAVTDGVTNASTDVWKNTLDEIHNNNDNNSVLKTRDSVVNEMDDGLVERRSSTKKTDDEKSAGDKRPRLSASSIDDVVKDAEQLMSSGSELEYSDHSSPREGSHLPLTRKTSQTNFERIMSSLSQVPNYSKRKSNGHNSEHIKKGQAVAGSNLLPAAGLLPTASARPRRSSFLHNMDPAAFSGLRVSNRSESPNPRTPESFKTSSHWDAASFTGAAAAGSPVGYSRMMRQTTQILEMLATVQACATSGRKADSALVAKLRKRTVELNLAVQSADL